MSGDNESGVQAEWEDADSGAIVRVLERGRFLVDKGFWSGREVQVADADYLNALEAQAARVVQLEKVAGEFCDEVNWLMECISGLEGFAHVHGYKPDVDDVLHGVQIRALVNDVRAALNQNPIARGEDHDDE